jgi:hypothetical protein
MAVTPYDMLRFASAVTSIFTMAAQQPEAEEQIVDDLEDYLQDASLVLDSRSPSPPSARLSRQEDEGKHKGLSPRTLT